MPRSELRPWKDGKNICCLSALLVFIHQRTHMNDICNINSTDTQLLSYANSMMLNLGFV